jgi:uncharacterized protein HemX
VKRFLDWLAAVLVVALVALVIGLLVYSMWPTQYRQSHSHLRRHRPALVASAVCNQRQGHVSRGMAMNVEQEIRSLQARLDRHDTDLAQLKGQFEFISGQLNSMQRFMHTKFDAMDKRFDQVDGRLGKMDGRLDKIEADVAGLREDLPGIVSDAVRSTLRPG